MRGKLANSPSREGANSPHWTSVCESTGDEHAGCSRSLSLDVVGRDEGMQAARDMASCVDTRLANRLKPEWLIQPCGLVLHDMTFTLVLVGVR